jgi:hypothetical protein
MLYGVNTLHNFTILYGVNTLHNFLPFLNQKYLQTYETKTICYMVCYLL